MRKARVYFQNKPAGVFTALDEKRGYLFEYDDTYCGSAISLTMPISQKRYTYQKWPTFFDGLLPEGPQLEALIRNNKIDRGDYFSQLVLIGGDLVGAVSVFEMKEDHV